MTGARKVIRLLVWAAGISAAAGAGFAGYFLWKPAPLPVSDIDQARRAYAAARLAPGVLAEDLALADSLSQALESGYADERARILRYRFPAGLAATARELQSTAARAESIAVGRRSGLLARQRERRLNLERRLEVISDEVAAMPGAKRLRRAHQHALMALGGAGVLEAQGNAAALVVQLDSATVAVDRAEILFDKRTGRLHDPALQERWQDWVEETVAATGKGKTAVVVDKLNRNCLVIRDRKVVARFPAELGRNGLADKLYAGDGATPEGKYKVSRKNPSSRYHRALLLDYPNPGDLAEHRQAARSGRVPRGAGPGGLIEIHGHGGRGTDWTEGCIALKDDDMERLFDMIEVGTPVTIVGAARLTGK